MMKINFNNLKNMTIGTEIEGIALVVTATKRQTKTNKDYVNVTLTDGIDQLMVNIWDWKSQNIPKPNDVVAITGTVSEYQGNKQINVATFKRSTEPVETFAPDGGVNVSAYKTRFRTFIDNIEDGFLKELVVRAFEDYEQLWNVVPGALSVHNDYIAGCLEHSVDVCQNAVALYANYSSIACLDLVIAGALLHDFGKLQTYKLEGAVIEMTDAGQLFDHLVLGAEEIGRIGNSILKEIGDENDRINCCRKLKLLKHIALAHHGKLEYGSPVTGKCPEAMIVTYADGMDAKMRTYSTANRKANPEDQWTEKIYFLDNKPMLTSNYIKSIFNR